MNMLQKNAYSPLWRRLLVMVYDLIIAIAILFPVTLLWLFFTKGQAITEQDSFRWLYQASLLLTLMAYFIVSWVRGGQTLGARAWQVRVTSLDGSRVTAYQATIRSLVALASLLVLGLGFLWSLWHPQRAAWHDLASGTRLISTKPAR